MNNLKYVDIPATVQIIGDIYKNPNFLSNDDKYRFREEDFPSSFQRIVFGCLNNLYQLGTKQFALEAVNDYLSTRPKAYSEYKVNKGDEYLLKCAEMANPATINFYYNRLKKMTLLRAYSDLGMDLTWLYDPDNILDVKKKQQQEEFLDNSSLLDISNLINDKIDRIKIQYVEQTETSGCKLGDHVTELLDSLKVSPAYGYPFYTKFMNVLTRGARLGKFYLRSAPSGVGKTRSMVADCCFWGCDQIWSIRENRWITIGAPQSTLYIATEQDEDEITTMALAFIAGVDEDHILTNNYFEGEEERVRKAAQILANGKVYFEFLPNFGITDIENTIKMHIREHQIQYAAFDYIHSSAKILTDIGGKSNIKNLREDNVLFLLSSALKELAVKYSIFVLSSTQLNAAYHDSDTPDESLLRGSKAIADRLDVGCIMLDATPEDKEKLEPFVKKNGLQMPNVKISFYKNRGNKYKSCYLWLYADKGCCRFEGAFLTDWSFQYMEVEDIKIRVEESSAF
jgi:replicative DNA helicase